ncbi:uncharacterized protein BDV14DRAFT_200637 [Aspergillus stella-maris]|uniref:uncharacterized protein n=1 Tax=Aspergillus stella-maris TaxID=1810926 RepID=UPI003CCCF6AE
MVYYELTPQEPDVFLERGLDGCRFPSLLRRKSRGDCRDHTTLAVIWLSLIALVSFLIFGVVIAARFVGTDNTGYDPDSAEYTLYKNTLFKTCYAQEPQVEYNCSGVHEQIFSPSDFQHHGIGILNRPDYRKPVYDIDADWCQVISCFKDWKVIPSKPRPSALWEVTNEEWISVILTLVAGLLQINTIYRESGNVGFDCKGRLGWDDWGGVAFDAVSAVWWWVGFGQWATDSAQTASLPTVLGWFSLWKYSELLQFHPFSCGIPFLRRRPRATRALRWILRIIAAAQWGIGAHVLTILQGSHSDAQVYDCLASAMQTAPGITACTAQQICSQEWLFKSPAFGGEFGDGVKPSLALLLAFAASTIAAAIPPFGLFACLVVPVAVGSEFKGYTYWKEKYDKINPGMTVATGVGTLYALIYGALYAASVGKEVERYGAVTFYRECTALNANVSPWRDYFDVDDRWAIRFARMLFNA